MFLNDCKLHNVKAITYTGDGEPTLHSKFSEILEFTYKNFEVGLFTNALKLIKYNPTHLKWLRISKTEQPFNIDNLKLARSSDNVGLCINYIGNQKEILESLELVYKYNLDYLQEDEACN